MPVSVSAAPARALPHDADESDDGTDPPKGGDVQRAWGHFTRRHGVAFMFMRERVPAVRALERGPWACLQAIAQHWQTGRMDAYPGQERLAMLSGYDARSIRTFTKTLERAGLIDMVKLKLPDGTSRIHYQPGPSLLAAVALFDTEYSDDRGQPGDPASIDSDAGRAVRARLEGQAYLPEPAEMASGRQAALASGELPDPREQKTSSSFPRVPSEMPGSNERGGPKALEVDSEVAREALATLRQRRFGRETKLFFTKDIAMVAACVSVINGDRETKMRAQLDAIEHAFSVSRGTPSPSYIWGSIDLFLQHETAGRSARLEQERLRARQVRAAKEELQRDREWSQRESCPPTPEALRFLQEHRPRRTPRS
jgi:hypothetical protein